ncbi:hypothetical protein [Eubacterium uniforme]|nr:hypothetical protein [Eubacterium uniforme]
MPGPPCPSGATVVAVNSVETSPAISVYVTPSLISGDEYNK